MLCLGSRGGIATCSLRSLTSFRSFNWFLRAELIEVLMFSSQLSPRSPIWFLRVVRIEVLSCVRAMEELYEFDVFLSAGALNKS